MSSQKQAKSRPKSAKTKLQTPPNPGSSTKTELQTHRTRILQKSQTPNSQTGFDPCIGLCKIDKNQLFFHNTYLPRKMLVILGIAFAHDAMLHTGRKFSHTFFSAAACDQKFLGLSQNAFSKLGYYYFEKLVMSLRIYCR